MKSLVDKISELMQIKSISGHRAEINQAVEWIKANYAIDGVRFYRWDFEGASPVLLLANCDGFDFDVATIGHIDVVPAEDRLFVPQIKDGRLYGRGGADMKATVVIGLETLLYTIGKKIKFGVLITSDEETTSNGMKAMQQADLIKSRVVLDTDSGDLTHIVEKYKHPVSVALRAKGENAHSSRPWDGINAVMALLNAIKELQQTFPDFEKNGLQPSSQWVDTMAVTAFNSPTTYNVVPAEAEARLNFRLTEKTSLLQLEELLDKVCRHYGCEFEVLLSSRGVYMDARNNPHIKEYQRLAEEIIGQSITITTSCGATDSRMFADQSAIIMHSINGENIHGDNEYAEIDSIYKLQAVQKALVEAVIKTYQA